MAEYSFEEFTAKVKERITEFLPKSYENSSVEIRPVMKNNEVLQGLVVNSPGSNMIPTIYLEGFFQEYLSGTDMDSVLQSIANMRVAHESSIDFNVDSIMKYEDVKEKISPRLIGMENNEEFLSNHPYTQMADLAVMYSLKLNEVDEGTMSIPITEAIMNMWGVSVETLHQDAVANMDRLNPVSIRPMIDVLKEMMPPELFGNLEEQEMAMPGLYVLSTENSQFGAIAVLNDEAMDRVALMAGKDYHVLPSSVHELLIIVNDGDADLAGLEAMVREVNETQVEPRDRLSDHVYRYDYDTRELYRADQEREHNLNKATSKEGFEKQDMSLNQKKDIPGKNKNHDLSL